MAKIAIAAGLVLVGLGIAGYMLPNEEIINSAGETVEEKKSITRLIPAFFGIPILICGVLALVKPGLTKHAMHGAATVGLLGALGGTVMGFLDLLKMVQGGVDFNARAFTFKLLLGVVCWMFVIACLQSFIAARRQRLAEQGPQTAEFNS